MTKWKKITLEECCHSITDGDHQSMPVSECGVPFIIISNIKNNRIDFEDTRFVPVEYIRMFHRFPLPQPDMRGALLTQMI